LLGNKFTQDLDSPGWTVDFYVGLGVGYKKSVTNWTNPDYDNFFKEKDKGNVFIPFRLGVLIGYLF
jgi:hypothetical protein